jgi:hypothetical protein
MCLREAASEDNQFLSTLLEKRLSRIRPVATGLLSTVVG